VTPLRSRLLCLGIGALLSSGTAIASPGSDLQRATANGESHDEVHTEISQSETATRPIRTHRQPSEYWVWNGQSRCWGEPGEYLYFDQPPPRPLGFKIPNPREVELALYERAVATASGGRVFTGEIRCQPLPEPRSPGGPRTPAGTAALTTRVEEWLKVPTPALNMWPLGTSDRPALTGSQTSFWVESHRPLGSPAYKSRRHASRGPGLAHRIPVGHG
jgi:hypothetical protein